MITLTVFVYLISSLGWFLAGIGSHCLYHQWKEDLRARPSA